MKKIDRLLLALASNDPRDERPTDEDIEDCFEEDDDEYYNNKYEL